MLQPGLGLAYATAALAGTTLTRFCSPRGLRHHLSHAHYWRCLDVGGACWLQQHWRMVADMVFMGQGLGRWRLCTGALVHAACATSFAWKVMQDD
jgi:hypothetical protein